MSHCIVHSDCELAACVGIVDEITRLRARIEVLEGIRLSTEPGWHQDVRLENQTLREENEQLKTQLTDTDELWRLADSRLVQARISVTIVSDLWHKLNRTLADMEAGQFALERALRALEEPK